jgi:rod shape-determining protein MreC
LNEHPEIKRLRTISFATVASIKSGFTSISSSLQNDEDLLKQKKINAQLMLEVNNLRNYREENEELQALLDYKKSTSLPLITSLVVSKKITKPRWNFIINTGASDSIKVGMPVINENGLVGIIYGTTENYSLVRTIRNIELNVAVKNQRTLVNGILTWDGENLIMKNIPTTYDMELGDRVVTSEFSTIIPPSIPVGLIVKKDTTQSGLLSNIIVSSFVDLARVENVFVYPVIKSKEVDKLEYNLLKDRSSK